MNSKSINTTTIITNQQPNVIKSRTLYTNDLPNTLDAMIATSVGSINNTSHKEGELLITQKKHPSSINYYIDTNGNLIVFSNTNDSDNYSIDSNGDLIYNH